MKRIYSLIAVLTIFAFATNANADEFTWDAGGGSDQNWDTATNWVNDAKPTSGSHTVTIGSESTPYTSIQNISGLSLDSINVHDGSTLRITQATTTTTTNLYASAILEVNENYTTSFIYSPNVSVGPFDAPPANAPTISIAAGKTFEINNGGANSQIRYSVNITGADKDTSIFKISAPDHWDYRAVIPYPALIQNVTINAEGGEIYCFADVYNANLNVGPNSRFTVRGEMSSVDTVVTDSVLGSSGQFINSTVRLEGNSSFITHNNITNTTITLNSTGSVDQYGGTISGGTIDINSGIFNAYGGTISGSTIDIAANSVMKFQNGSTAENIILNADERGRVRAKVNVDTKTFEFKNSSKLITYIYRNQEDGNLYINKITTDTALADNGGNKPGVIGEVKIQINHNSIQEAKGETVSLPIFYSENGLGVLTEGSETEEQAKARILAKYNDPNSGYFDFSAFNPELYQGRIEFCTLGKSLLLVVERIHSYEEVADSQNKAIAKSLDGGNLHKCGSGFAQLLNALDGTHTHEEYNQALDDLKPRQITSARLITHNAGLAALSQMTAYRTSRRQALKGIPYKLTINPSETGIASTDINPGTTLAQALPLNPGERKDRELGKDKMVNVFARATTGYTRVGSGSNRIGLRSSRVGAVFGIDVRLHENFLVGFTGSYDYNDVHFLSHRGSGRVNSYRFGPYAMMYHDNWFFEAELTLGLHNNKFRRRVAIGNDVFLPEAQYNSIDFTASIGAGYDFRVGGFTITPRVNLQYQFYHSDRVSEKNGGGANLKLSKYDTSALSSRLGVEFWKRFEVNERYLSAVTPFFNVGWRHEWLAPTDLTSQFEGGGSSFNIDNDLFSRNAIYLGIGGTAELTEQLNLDVRYQADLGDRENRSQNIYLSLRYKF